MNQYNINDKLDGDSSKQRRYYLFGVLSVFFIAVAVTIGLMSTNGTKIEVRPFEAQDSAIITVSGGLGLYISGSVYSLTNSTKITVIADGYKPKEQIIPQSSIGKVFQIELIELPGRLVIETMPADAKTSWLIDGKTVAIANRLEKEIYAGKYSITIDNPYYDKHMEKVKIVRQQETRLNINLNPIFGEIDIKSEPSNAVVSINGKNVGFTPLKHRGVGGKYHIQISSPNYINVTDDILITRDGNFIIRKYNLKLQKAYITVNVKPKGGDLLLNGATILPDKKITVDAIRKNTILYHKKGYFSDTKAINLKPAEEKEINFTLKPEIGNVEFISVPVADVFINGKNIGITPLQKKLPALSYKVTFKRQGYRSITKSFTPVASAMQKISVYLKAELEARLSETSKQYTNSAGVKLKLFLPSGKKFMMGTPRHEKGQRANEFIREIKLTKPFYAGIYEITNQEFAKFSNKTTSASANLPVISVNWLDAAKFCNWLSKREKLSSVYNIQNGQLISFNGKSDGYRLLSEAEWEWLARNAGKIGQTKFSWGDRLIIPPKAANIADESAKGTVRFYIPQYTDGYPNTAPVGSFNKEPSGLYDLAGNVSEWVHDFYSMLPPDKGQVDQDPLGDLKGKNHMIKGASWRSGTITELRPAFREVITNGRDDIGFRIGRYLYGGG